jgi:ABC-type Mn2+/Zn2+ transport system ATPase subunit
MFQSCCYKRRKAKTDVDADIENQELLVNRSQEALVNRGKKVLSVSRETATLIHQLIFKDNLFMSICSLLVPILTTFVGTHKNRMFNGFRDGDDTGTLILMFVFYEIMSSIIQNHFIWRFSNDIFVKTKVALDKAKIKCSVKVPGVNLSKCNEMIEHNHKIRDFVIVPGMIWTTLISFLMTINGLENLGSQIVIGISSLLTLILLISINDSSLYQRDKYDPRKITSLWDPELVRIRHSLGAVIDYDHHFKKMDMQKRQASMQKVIVCGLNFVVIWVTLTSASKHYVLNFMSITWLISCLADNIKGLQYYSFVKEYLEMTAHFEQHGYKCSGKSGAKVAITQIKLSNVSYGYLNDLRDSEYDIKIKNLSCVFDIGKIYYIEAPNGVGKSTLLRIFTHNIASGEIYFGNTNRYDMTWEQVHSSVFHVVQASEFCPKFRKEDIDIKKHIDPYLINGLRISKLMGKSTDEMSGGEKQRINIYMALTSSAPIILLDEILSEISVIPSDDDPEGLRSRVINTIIGWPNRTNKLILIVGHGVFNDCDEIDVIKLKIDNSSSENTKLIKM